MRDLVTPAETQRPFAAQETPPRRFTWHRLLPIAGIVATVSVGTVSVVLADVEGAAVTLGFALATWLTRLRRGTVGAIGVTLLGAFTLYFMATAAVTNVREGSPMSSVLIASWLAAASLLSVIAAAGFLLSRLSKSSTGPRLAVGTSVLLLSGLVTWGMTTTRVEVNEGDVVLVSQDMAFSATQLSVDPGEVVVTMENKDLFWHTFTIEELGVDLRVPVGAELAASFEASPGEYQFICAIPGHPEAGMMGTLTVVR